MIPVCRKKSTPLKMGCFFALSFTASFTAYPHFFVVIAAQIGYNSLNNVTVSSRGCCSEPRVMQKNMDKMRSNHREIDVDCSHKTRGNSLTYGSRLHMTGQYPS